MQQEIPSRSVGRLFGLIPFLVACCMLAPTAQAVPSFARQTGMTCEACHTIFPELTHFGRMFKANGYTLDNLKQVRGVAATKEEMLSLSDLPPIAAMIQISATQLGKALPDSTDNAQRSQSSTVDFPQQISLFYAGKVAPHVGAFVQLTYGNDSGSIGIDNTDIRYADNIVINHRHSLVYGLSLNNNPTVQDLWNSTPAFGFPFAATASGVGSIAAAQIDGTLGQDVAGLTVYAMWDESLYAEVGLYRSAKQGSSNPITGATGPLDGATSNVISGNAPYARIAYEYQWGRHSLEAGVYGARFKLSPGDGTPLNGPVDEFRDIAQDLQYQFIGDQHLFTLTATRIHEKMSLDAAFAAGSSANVDNDLTTVRVIGNYYFRHKFGGAIGHFSTNGSTDPVLYAPDPVPPGVVTSANGAPDTRGWIVELNYLPWLNTKLSLQYTRYDRFNGGADNYDGAGRNASDNDTWYALLWLNF